MERDSPGCPIRDFPGKYPEKGKWHSLFPFSLNPGTAFFALIVILVAQMSYKVFTLYVAESILKLH